MAYYQKVLLPEEKLLHLGRLHWAIYLRAWVLFAIVVIAIVALLAERRASPPPAEWVVPALELAAVVFVVLALLSALGAWIRRRTTEIVVTDRRIIFKQGLLRRRTIEMTMNKVESVDVIQSISGRIFNFGTVLIRGTGSTYEPLAMVADPLTLRTAIVAH
jgi:uncharacterized membrane protein YdbT with pleckstrin-like domain